MSTATHQWEATMAAEDLPGPHQGGPSTVILEPYIRAVSDRVAELVASKIADGTRTPWMDKAEAIEYSRLKPGTFEKLTASGQIPSHGGKTKTYHREELDEALGYQGGR